MANHPPKGAPMGGSKADLKPLGRLIRMLFHDYPVMLTVTIICIVLSAVIGVLPALYI